MIGTLWRAATGQPLRGVVAGDGALALDGEEPGELLEALQSDLVATAGRLDQPPSPVAPASGPLTAGTLQEAVELTRFGGHPRSVKRA